MAEDFLVDAAHGCEARVLPEAVLVAAGKDLRVTALPKTTDVSDVSPGSAVAGHGEVMLDVTDAWISKSKLKFTAICDDVRYFCWIKWICAKILQNKILLGGHGTFCRRSASFRVVTAAELQLDWELFT